MKRCIAPCLTGAETVGYEDIVLEASSILNGNSSAVSRKLMEKIVTLVTEEKFEDAALVRDRMHALEDGVHRSSRLREITAIPLVIAAQANALGGWEIHAISHGRFAGAIVAPQVKTQSLIYSSSRVPLHQTLVYQRLCPRSN